MALMVDRQEVNKFKHHCKICKKGFGCGRALGGHMRAHGIGHDSGTHIDDDEENDQDPAVSEWGGDGDGVGDQNVPANGGYKHMYALRTNPNRLKCCRFCGNCGKEFLSGKCALEHGKCESDDADDQSLVSFPGSEDNGDQDGMTTPTKRGSCGGNWSKRKRSFRAKVGDIVSNCPSSEEEDLALANCLMMLSNATANPLITEPEESCASASKEDQDRRISSHQINNFVASVVTPQVPDYKAKGTVGSNKGLFECKACKKVFNSHQALGGHRASHKKVKGCYAARFEQVQKDSTTLGDDQEVIMQDGLFAPSTKTISIMQYNQGLKTQAASTSKKKSKVHECSICHRVFSTGQALGGHKRCHWITSNTQDATSLIEFQQLQDHLEQIQQKSLSVISNSEQVNLALDLNLPAAAAAANIAAANEHSAMKVQGEQLLEKPIAGFDMSTQICLQPWIEKIDGSEKEETNNKDNTTDHYNNDNSLMQLNNPEDEADSKVKLAKLSKLKDINTTGDSPPWLQVGFGSTADAKPDL